MTGREIVAAIIRGCKDNTLRALAAGYAAENLKAAMEADHVRAPMKIRASDAGRCVREVWADVHDKFDLPLDPVTQLSRFDIGTTYGVWLAALLKATLETESKNHIKVKLEMDLDRNNVSGHADAIIFFAKFADAKLVGYVAETAVEFKSTYGLKNKELPSDKKPYQSVQVNNYALDVKVGAPKAALITFAPAAWPVDDRFTFEDYDPETWEIRVDVEYDRLTAALQATTPEGDPAEKWRCSGCRAGWCERNTNPMKNALSAADMEG